MATLIGQTNVRTVKLMKWPIILFLAFTALPAGMFPFGVAEANRQVKQLQAVNPKFQDQALIERTTGRVSFYAGLSIIFLIVQGSLSWLAWSKWDEPFLELRGAVWLLLLWGTFAVGAGTGMFILCTGG